MSKAHDYIAKVENRAGKIENRRLRMYIESELQRAYDKAANLEARMQAVIDGFNVYDPASQKAIALSRRER